MKQLETQIRKTKYRTSSISQRKKNIVKLVETNKKQWKLAFKIDAQFDLLDHVFSYDTNTAEELHD